MYYAVIETGGKQYRVSEGDIVFIEKLEAEAKSSVTFSNVLAVSNGKKMEYGNPYIKGAQVKAKVLKHGKGEKITVFTYKPKKDSKRKLGHRQPYTKVEIESIEGVAGIEKEEPKKATTTKKAAGTSAAKKTTEAKKATGTTATKKATTTKKATGTTAAKKATTTKKATGTTAAKKATTAKKATGTTAAKKTTTAKKATGTTAAKKTTTAKKATGTTTAKKTTTTKKTTSTAKKTGTTAKKPATSAKKTTATKKTDNEG